MDRSLGLVFQKAPTQTQRILPQQSAGKVVRMPGLIGYKDWQNANGVRPEDGDGIAHGSHFGCARCLVWAIIFEMGLLTVLLLCWRLPRFIWH
jgi:hypothetical protein